MVGPIESTFTEDIAQQERRIVLYLGWALSAVAAASAGMAIVRPSEWILFTAAAVVSGLLAAVILLEARRRASRSRTP